MNLPTVDIGRAIGRRALVGAATGVLAGAVTSQVRGLVAYVAHALALDLGLRVEREVFA